MAVAFRCPLCSHTRSYSDAALGRKVKCDECGAKIRINDATKFSVIEQPASAPTGETYMMEAIHTCKVCDESFAGKADETGRLKCPKCGTLFAV